MSQLLEKFSAQLGAFGKKLQARDSAALAVAGVGVAVVSYGLFRVLTRPGDGPAYASEEQKALAEPFEYRAPSGAVIKVQPVKPCSIEPAAAALASGNADDAMVVACAKGHYDHAQREAALRWLSRVLLRSTVPSSYGAVVLQTAGGEAAAIWFPKGQEISMSALVYNGALQYIWQYSGWDRRGRWLGLGEAIAAIRQRVMADTASAAPGNYYHLLNIGARAELAPAAREEHLAAVVKPVTERADRTGVPCVVQTTSEEQRDFFLRQGFALADESALYKASVYTLTRQPGKL